jgi:hypothetical protein
LETSTIGYKRLRLGYSGQVWANLLNFIVNKFHTKGIITDKVILKGLKPRRWEARDKETRNYETKDYKARRLGNLETRDWETRDWETRDWEARD